MTLHTFSASVLCLVGALWTTFALIACEGSGTAGPQLGAGGGGGGGTGGDSAVSLRFVDAGPIELLPEEGRVLSVVVTPPDEYRVGFAILADPQSQVNNDAALDRSEVDTDPDGRASVTLYGPTLASTFTVRATISELASTSLSVSVRDKGYAELQVTPRYDETRAIETWTADARAGTSCANLTTIPEEDSSITASSAFGIPPRLTDVPLGTVLAVTLRAGHYVYGCTNVGNLVANTLNTVMVHAHDLPLDMEGANLNLEFGISETLPEWALHLEQSSDLAREALVGDSVNDVQLLLDSMHGLIESSRDREVFQAARLESGWETVALQGLGWSDGATLRNAFSQWLLDGSLSLSVEDTFKGRVIQGREPTFELDGIAGLSPGAVDAPSETSAVWLAEPGDTLLFRTTLSWSPTLLLTQLAGREAGSETSSPLASLVDCGALASAITRGDTSQIYSGCSMECTEDLCAAALDELWSTAESAGSGTISLDVTGISAVEVDDVARPKTAKGSWLGSLAGSESGTVGGPLRGAAPGELLPP